MKKPLLILLFLLNLQTLKAADGAPSGEPGIRISIYMGISSFKLSTRGRAYATELKTGTKFLLVKNSIYEIKALDSKFLYIGKQKLQSPVSLSTPDGLNYLRLNSKKYKGNLRIVSYDNSTLNVIEEISLEKYLYGVLTSEMGPSWPLEALKAQAVASRTYAAKHLNPKKDYDITDDTTYQVYSGIQNVNSVILEAVNSTAGEILTYNNKIVTAFFHACCGGRTTTPSAAWGEDIIKPLRGVTDPYCKISNHYSWKLFVKESELLSFIQKNGSTSLKIKGVKPYSKDRSGRVVKLVFATDKGNFRAEMSELRKYIGTFEFKSTYITKIEKVSSGYFFYGKGWGHGVGMCQEGAKQMAYKGKKYKQILGFYYPGAKISDIEDILK